MEDITKEQSANVEEVELEEVDLEEVTQEAESTTEEVVEEVSSKEAEYLDRLKRTMAEFDNYRKRTDKEKSNMYDMGLSDTVLSILPVIDNFERALATPCSDDSYAKGMELIYKQMLDLLSSIGVTQIEALGKAFDTDIHNAVMHVEDENFGESEIIEEFQKGYIYKEEKVIRFSMVKVAN